MADERKLSWQGWGGYYLCQVTSSQRREMISHHCRYLKWERCEYDHACTEIDPRVYCSVVRVNASYHLYCQCAIELENKVSSDIQT